MKTVPAFCSECGSAFSWTKAGIQAVRDLADELEQLTSEERDQLKESINDLIRDTPQTTVAATRFRRLVSKAGTTALEGFRTILVSIATEAAKKVLFPGSH